VASRIRRTAAVISGPIPSPGISPIRGLLIAQYLGWFELWIDRHYPVTI
jgi:hypothetical protein